MKTTLRYTLCLLALLACMTNAWALEVESTSGGLEHLVSDHSVTTLKVTGTMDARDFKFIGYELTELTELNLAGVTIEAYSDVAHPLIGTTYTFESDVIPHNSLIGAKLENVVLPEGLKGIGQAAFAGNTALRSITFPSTLTSIGSYAFNGSGLTSVTIPEGITHLGEGVFAHCASLESVTLQGAVAVPARAFLGDVLLSAVTFAPGTPAIGDAAFTGCAALAQIALPATLGSIGREAFMESGLTSVDLSACTQLASVGDWAFARTPLTTAVLPATLASLGNGTFFYCDQLGDLVIPTSLTTTGDFLLAGAIGITRNDLLNEGMLTVGDYALYGLAQAKYFTIPASVRYLGERAMAGMTGLDTIYVSAAPARLGENVWDGVNQPEVTLYTPTDKMSIDYGKLDQWREFHIVMDYLLGDVNGDKDIDVLDLNAMINYLLGVEPYIFIFPAADINASSDIEGSDLNSLVSKILTGERVIARRVRGMGDNAPLYATTTDVVTVEPLTINAGARRTLDVALTALEHSYSALQADITLPEGLHFVGNATGSERTNRHTVASNCDDRHARIIIYSTDHATIAGSEGVIATLNVEADSRFIAGEPIAVSDVVLATADDEKLLSDNTWAEVATTTGVADLSEATWRVVGAQGEIVITGDATEQAQVVMLSGAYTTVDLQPGENRIAAEPGVYVVRLAGHSHKIVVR